MSLTAANVQERAHYLPIPNPATAREGTAFAQIRNPHHGTTAPSPLGTPTWSLSCGFLGYVGNEE